MGKCLQEQSPLNLTWLYPWLEDFQKTIMTPKKKKITITPTAAPRVEQ
jgi:hypothetical protein